MSKSIRFFLGCCPSPQQVEGRDVGQENCPVGGKGPQNNEREAPREDAETFAPVALHTAVPYVLLKNGTYSNKHWKKSLKQMLKTC